MHRAESLSPRHFEVHRAPSTMQIEHSASRSQKYTCEIIYVDLPVFVKSTQMATPRTALTIPLRFPFSSRMTYQETTMGASILGRDSRCRVIIQGHRSLTCRKGSDNNRNPRGNSMHCNIQYLGYHAKQFVISRLWIVVIYTVQNGRSRVSKSHI